MSLHPIFDFLTELEQHNQREWYHTNKLPRQQAEACFTAWLEQILFALRESDCELPLLDPKQLTFKMVRDTRFSHDKSPYNPCFRAHLGPKGKLPIPVGYYIMLRPGNRSFLGGGLFADMFQDATSMVRQAIAEQGTRWESIISDPAFANKFTVGGTALKKVPAGYDAAHPQAQYLKQKSWYLEYPLTDEQVLGKEFLTFATETFQAMQPFHTFLNEAMAQFEMPER